MSFSFSKIFTSFQLETKTTFYKQCWPYVLDAVGSSEISKGKQKLGVTFNFDKQDVIDFMKFSKMTMCRASEANSYKES